MLGQRRRRWVNVSCLLGMERYLYNQGYSYLVLSHQTRGVEPALVQRRRKLCNFKTKLTKRILFAGVCFGPFILKTVVF